MRTRPPVTFQSHGDRAVMYDPAAARFSGAVAEIKCCRCGVRMTVKLQSTGKTVKQDVHIYPATGDSRISKEILLYFFSVLGTNTEDMKRGGYRVLDTTPTVHAITPPGPWL